MISCRQLIVPLLILSLLCVPLWANGRKIIPGQYETRKELGDGSCFFRAEAEKVMLQLATVGGKYAVVRVEIDNRSGQPLTLSLKDDSATVQINDRSFAAVLDLRTAAPAIWDGMSPDLRSAIAYPQQVAPHEIGHVYVFIPVESATDIPAFIELKLKAHGVVRVGQRVVESAK